MRRLFLLLLPLALACGDDDSTTQPTLAFLAGTWDLQSVNGSPLPYVVLQTSTSKSELMSDVITVTTTGSYTQLTTVRNTLNGQVTTQTGNGAGTFTLNGTALTFQASNGTSGTGTVSGTTFTLPLAGSSYLYKKR